MSKGKAPALYLGQEDEMFGSLAEGWTDDTPPVSRVHLAHHDLTFYSPSYSFKCPRKISNGTDAVA